VITWAAPDSAIGDGIRTMPPLHLRRLDGKGQHCRLVVLWARQSLRHS
jgi:hypothetical protein